MAKKFKVGDKVVVKDTYSLPSRRGLVGTVKRIERESGVWNGDLISVEFDEPIKDGWDCYGYTKIGFGWRIREPYLEPVKVEKIIIRREGNKVIAHCTHVDKRAEAKCSPEDTFDFEVGAKLAFRRLMGEPESEPEDTWYNGKVVCVDNELNTTIHTVGKIYEFKDGYMIADDGGHRPYRAVKSFKDFMTLTASNFIEVVE